MCTQVYDIQTLGGNRSRSSSSFPARKVLAGIIICGFVCTIGQLGGVRTGTASLAAPLASITSPYSVLPAVSSRANGGGGGPPRCRVRRVGLRTRQQ